jgi:hypothetical protein
MTLALALSVASLLGSAVAVSLATACYFACRAVTKRHSMTSLRAELDEIQDAIGKHSALLKRVNQRTVMQERREAAKDEPEASSAQRPGESAADWKRRMRARLIPPGQPARHQ